MRAFHMRRNVRRRVLVVALGLTAFPLAACPLTGPEPDVALDARFVATDALADTVVLRADHSGERRGRHVFHLADGSLLDTVETVTTFTYRGPAERIELTLTCPPGASCVAGPHYRAVLDEPELTVTPAIGTVEPTRRYRRVGGNGE